eukprot:scaffold163857_cov52-Prasinocladus_malaysianus.AAC.1
MQARLPSARMTTAKQYQGCPQPSHLPMIGAVCLSLWKPDKAMKGQRKGRAVYDTALDEFTMAEMRKCNEVFAPIYAGSRPSTLVAIIWPQTMRVDK